MSKEKKYILPVIFGAVFCIATLSIGILKLTVYAQQSPVRENSPVEREKFAVNKTASTAPIVSATATKENLALKDALEWELGAKPQRGWSLYVALIRQTINTEADTGKIEFARAVAAWQQKSGLLPTGAIDRETLYKMIELWQSRRFKGGAYAADEDLLTAPITDFYDPTRQIELLRVERETYRAYKKMLAAAIVELELKADKNGELAADEKFLRIVSAFRSKEYQEKLRLASPQSGRAGLAVNSPHFTGHALDIYVGGEPTITKDANRAVQVETRVYKWLVKNASRFGFYPYFYEPWHWEYVPQNSKPK